MNLVNRLISITFCYFFSLNPNTWVLCDMTTIEIFSIKMTMKYDDVGLTPIWSNFPDVHYFHTQIFKNYLPLFY